MTKASNNPFPSVLLDHTSNTAISNPDAFETRFFADGDGTLKTKDSGGTVTTVGAGAASSAVSTHEGESDPHTGYETLIYDCMNGDATLFKRADHIELGWDIVQPVLDVWHALPPRDFPNYAAGTWGPAAADLLVADDRRRWHGCTAPA